jgi:hypothetical protein
MIRFGVIVTVVVASVGLLIVGAVAGDLTLVYVSIALAAVALLLVIVGVAVWRDEVFASSGRRDERDLARVGAVGRVGRAATGPSVVEGWPERRLQGGDTRECAIPVGAPPDRDAPAERDRRSGEPRPAEQPLRPADPAARPGREVRRRDPRDREAVTEDWPGRDLAAADRPGRDAAAAGWPGPDAAQGERSARDAAAADRAARETVSAHRPDRVERYPVLGPERYESADDPTRLAHRLDSLADFGRQADADATGSARSRAGRPGGQRSPAPIDPLAGPPGDRWSVAEPLAGASSTGRAAARPTGTEQGATADADAPQPSRAVSPTPVSATTAPSTTGAATAKDLGSRGPVPPAESGPGRRESGRDRADGPVADSPAGPSAWPHVPSGSGARLPAEAASAATAAPPDLVGTVAASEAGASAGASPGTAGPAATDAGAAAGPAVGLDDQVSVVPGIARYHKADCILIRFLSEDDLEVMSRRDAEAAGCAPCRACRPDRPSASD